MSQHYKSILPINGLEIINGNEITFILTGAGYTKSSSVATACAIEGFLESYNFKDFKIETMEGFVKVLGVSRL